MGYQYKPIPPALAPVNTYLSELLQRKPQSIQEAETMGADVDSALTKILTATVTPMPEKQDYYKYFKIVTDLTNKTLDEAGWFREPGKPNPPKGSAAGHAAPKKTK